MKIDVDKTGESFTLYTENTSLLTKDQAYGLPVKNDSNEIIGFVSDVDEDYIYIHIFDKKTVDDMGSMEILHTSLLGKLLYRFKKKCEGWYG